MHIHICLTCNCVSHFTAAAPVESLASSDGFDGYLRCSARRTHSFKSFNLCPRFTRAFVSKRGGRGKGRDISKCAEVIPSLQLTSGEEMRLREKFHTFDNLFKKNFSLEIPARPRCSSVYCGFFVSDKSSAQTPPRRAPRPFSASFLFLRASEHVSYPSK